MSIDRHILRLRNMKRETRFRVGLAATALGLLAVLAGRHLVAADPSWFAVTGRPLEAGMTLKEFDLTLGEGEASRFPDLPLKAEQVVGRTLRQSKPAGEPIFETDLAPAPSKTLAGLVPEGHLAVSIGASRFGPTVRHLNRGDRIDLLALDAEALPGARARVIVRRAVVLGLVTPPSGSEAAESKRPFGLAAAAAKPETKAGAPSLVLAIRPNDVTSLAEVSASGTSLRYALHGDDLDSSLVAHKKVELLVGANRREIYLP